jgi:tetratricopeptide (TPR) repeat protein
LNPTSVIIQHNLGLLFEKQGQLDVAEKRYKELLNSNPSFLLAKYNLALIYYHRGDFLTATQAFSEILTAHPDFHFATYYQGLTLMKLGKLSEAYALLRKLLRAVPDFAPLYNDLGHIAALLHKKSQARRYFEQCRELDTTLHLPLYNLALLDFGEGKTKSALEALQTITERFPQFVEAHCDLGLIRYQQGAPINLVLENYQQALQIDPKHSRTLFNMGLLYDESDDVKSAITWYENCLATQPTHLECLNNLSLLYCSTGQFDKARDYALRALEVNKGYEPARFNLALALYRNGHGGDALALFEEVATNLGQTGQNPELLQQSLKIINILRQELKR